MNPPEVILEIRNASFGYRGRGMEKVLLRKASLHLRQGELVCLLGRNGSGKSTLLRTIMKLIPLYRGEIFLMGKKLDTYQPAEMARTCGFVPTGLVNAGEMTVRELVELGRYPYTNWYGKMTREDISAVDQALHAVGLDELQHGKITEISDGEKQRAMIARTLAQSTRLILLDEPSAFLDIPNKYGITTLLRNLCSQGHSAVFSTHDLSLALHYADKIWLIDDGLITEGAPEDLVLSGKIQHLFDSEKVGFDRLSGDFRPMPSYRGSAYVETAGVSDETGIWTVKALHRSGYRQTRERREAAFSIAFHDENGRKVWNLQQENENLLFYSLYDLTLHLNQQKYELR